jgi:hypothetical protein
MANRGLYGQSEGNEKRDAVSQFVDQIADNDIAEADVVDPLRALWHFGAWDSFDTFIYDVETEWLLRGPDEESEPKEYEHWRGAVKTRINSIVTRATFDTPNFFLFKEGESLGNAGAKMVANKSL